MMHDNCDTECGQDDCVKTSVVAAQFILPSEPDDNPIHFHACEDHESNLHALEDSMREKFPDTVVEWIRE